MVPTLPMMSMKGIGTSFTATGTPFSNRSSIYAGASGHCAGSLVSV